jgi:hypothetical protein
MTIIGWTVTFLALTAIAAFRRHWTRAGSSLLVLACAAPISLAVLVLSGDYVHLLMLYPYYLSKIHQSSETAKAPVRFAWGDDAVSVLDGIRLRILIYDPSDETASAIGQIKRQEGLVISTWRLAGDFYIQEANTP